MLTLTLFAIASSLFTEAVRLIDKWLFGTPAQGRGAFLLAFFIAFIAAAVKVLAVDRIPELALALKAAWQTLLAIFTLSQLWYQLIAKTFGIRTELQ